MQSSEAKSLLLTLNKMIASIDRIAENTKREEEKSIDAELRLVKFQSLNWCLEQIQDILIPSLDAYQKAIALRNFEKELIKKIESL